MEWIVSHTDVEKHPRYSETGDRALLEGILRSYGMNVNVGYQTDSRDTHEKPEDWPKDNPHFGNYHRSQFTGEISNGPRYIGTAREDGKWKRFVSDFLELQY